MKRANFSLLSIKKELQSQIVAPICASDLDQSCFLFQQSSQCHFNAKWKRIDIEKNKNCSRKHSSLF